MASFTVYDPRTKAFRALETADTIDLPFEQVLLINILLELRVITEYMSSQSQDAGDPPWEDSEEIRASMVQEIGAQA